MPAPAADEHPTLSAFIDSLWLEEGLSRNTLEAYRRDLVLFAQWLSPRGTALPEATEADLNAYFAARHWALIVPLLALLAMLAGTWHLATRPAVVDDVQGLVAMGDAGGEDGEIRAPEFVRVADGAVDDDAAQLFEHRVAHHDLAQILDVHQDTEGETIAFIALIIGK